MRSSRVSAQSFRKAGTSGSSTGLVACNVCFCRGTTLAPPLFSPPQVPKRCSLGRRRAIAWSGVGASREREVRKTWRRWIGSSCARCAQRPSQQLLLQFSCSRTELHGSPLGVSSRVIFLGVLLLPQVRTNGGIVVWSDGEGQKDEHRQAIDKSAPPYWTPPVP